MKKIIVYTLWLFIGGSPLLVLGQPANTDITGIWKGELYVDSTKLNHPYELSISEDNGKLSGYSRITFEQKGIRHVVIRDHTVVRNGNELIIEDEKQLSKASSISQPKEVRKKMIVNISGSDSALSMSGTWSTNRTRVFLAATGSVQMTKQKDFRQSALYQKLDSLAITAKLSYTKPTETAAVAVVKQAPAPPPDIDRYLVKKAPLEMPLIDRKKMAVRPFALSTRKVPIIKPKTLYYAVKEKKPAVAQPPVAKVDAPVAATAPVVAAKRPLPEARRNMNTNVDPTAAVEFMNRNNKTQQEVFFRSDSLQLTLYDNGEIDGDTVSVLMNGKVIIARQGLNIRPNVHTVYIDQETPDPIELVMYAENLGSIAPNTGLLVVKDGTSVYEVRFSADLKTNAAIILRRKND
jgi:hypothetical protein